MIFCSNWKFSKCRSGRTNWNKVWNGRGLLRWRARMKAKLLPFKERSFHSFSPSAPFFFFAHICSARHQSLHTDLEILTRNEMSGFYSACMKALPLFLHMDEGLFSFSPYFIFPSNPAVMAYFKYKMCVSRNICATRARTYTLRIHICTVRYILLSFFF